jgi:hypothetical protein
VTAAIVTCGGLCPGLNDVVQNIVYTLADYGVPLDQVLCIPSCFFPAQLQHCSMLASNSTTKIVSMPTHRK